MAVFQGSRLPASMVPAQPARLAHGRPRLSAGHVRGVRPAGMVIGVILVGTLLALVYLTQTLRAAATSVEIERLRETSAQLQRELRSQQSLLLHWSSQPVVTQWAQQAGLDTLGDTLILTVP